MRLLLFFTLCCSLKSYGEANKPLQQAEAPQKIMLPPNAKGIKKMPPGNGVPNMAKEIPESVKDTGFDLMAIINEDYKYDPRGKRDPFQPYEEVRPIEFGEEVLEPSLPLQRFNLDQLSLVGVIWGGKKPLAMLVDDSNKVYYVREQDPIGRNGGMVAKIREGEIVVLEVYIDGVGNKAYRPRVLKLQKRKLGKK